MKQHMTTIDTTPATTDATRITGPLVQPIPDPFSMVIRVMSEEERVTIPGVLLYDPEFVEGYVCGQASYFSEVDRLLDQDGHVVESLTESQLPCVKPVKVRDITDQDVMAFIVEAMRPDTARELAFCGPLTLAWRAGLIFGYVHACIETARLTERGELSLRNGFPYQVTTDMGEHCVEVQDEGWLTIEAKGYSFRVPLVNLEPHETEQVLGTLLMAKNGLYPSPTQEATA